MDSLRPHWTHCATTVICYPLASKPLEAPDKAIQAANVNPRQFLQIIHVVSTQVFPLLHWQKAGHVPSM